MIPVVHPDEMAAIDRAAPEPVEVLIGRAGAAVARAALDLLGGGYGRRVVVIAGKGNNGNDGRAAARRLRRRGVRVVEVTTADGVEVLPPADLVVDAAFGTGFRGTWTSPVPAHPATPVLAVDIPSGIDGVTGRAEGRPLAATRTVTFAALKPGLLQGDGSRFAGSWQVADIGLDTGSARAHLLTDDDVTTGIAPRPPDAHKWRTAVWAVAGSPGMEGAAALVAAGALRAGAGYLRASAPGVPAPTSAGMPVEAVGHPVASDGWDEVVLAEVGRFACLVVGNGLGTSGATTAALRRVVARSPVPVVVDADGLTALGSDAVEVLRDASAPVVLTPHEGEFARLAGTPPGADRLAATRALAARLGVTVLLKGPLTVVADPDGRVLLSDSGDARLATAGTGDVLAGMVAAFLARGCPPLEAAALAAFVHGRAAALGSREGFVAGDLPALIPPALDGLRGP